MLSCFFLTSLPEILKGFRFFLFQRQSMDFPWFQNGFPREFKRFSRGFQGFNVPGFSVENADHPVSVRAPPKGRSCSWHNSPPANRGLSWPRTRNAP